MTTRYQSNDSELQYVQAMRQYVDLVRSSIAMLAGEALMSASPLDHLQGVPDFNLRKVLDGKQRLASITPPQSLCRQHHLIAAALDVVVDAAEGIQGAERGRAAVLCWDTLSRVKAAYQLLAQASKLVPSWELVDMSRCCASLISHGHQEHVKEAE